MRRTDARVKVSEYQQSCLILAVLLLASTFWATEAAAQSQNIVSINSYVRKVDQFGKHHKKRVFANVTSETDRPEDWREFNAAKVEHGEAIFDGLAYVWQKNTKVVEADFRVITQSGDWTQYIDYYFREDGTLAKIHAHLNTFHGNLSVIRDTFYDRRGKLLHTSARFLDRNSQQPTKSIDFMDQEIPLYLSVRDLPFYDLL